MGHNFKIIRSPPLWDTVPRKHFYIDIDSFPFQEYRQAMMDEGSYLCSCKPCKLFSIHPQLISSVESVLNILLTRQDEEVSDIQTLDPLDLFLDHLHISSDKFVDQVSDWEVEE